MGIGNDADGSRFERAGGRVVPIEYNLIARLSNKRPSLKLGV